MKYVIPFFALLMLGTAFAATGTKNTTEKNPPTAMPKNNQTSQLDDLLRGELAALEAYDVALKDVKEPQQKAKLQDLRKDHEYAVSYLSRFVASKQEMLEDTEDSGAWGEFAKAWTKTRSLTGNEGAVKALIQGEEHGISEYKEALKDDSLSAELKQEIRTKLLPRQEKHIESLKTLI